MTPFDIEADFFHWRKQLTPSKKRVILDRAERRYQLYDGTRLEWSDEGFPILDPNREELALDAHGAVLIHPVNECSFNYLVFDEEKKMYNRQVTQALIDYGVIEVVGIKSDGSYLYQNVISAIRSSDQALYLMQQLRDNF